MNGRVVAVVEERDVSRLHRHSGKIGLRVVWWEQCFALIMSIWCMPSSIDLTERFGYIDEETSLPIEIPHTLSRLFHAMSLPNIRFSSAWTITYVCKWWSQNKIMTTTAFWLTSFSRFANPYIWCEWYSLS